MPRCQRGHARPLNAASTSHTVVVILSPMVAVTFSTLPTTVNVISSLNNEGEKITLTPVFQELCQY